MAIALMNELCIRGHAVELLSWDLCGATTYYPLDSRVVWHRLNMGDAREKASWKLRVQRQISIRQLVRKMAPDVVIAYQHGPFLTVATAIAGLGIPVVAAERNAPQRFDHLRVGKHRALIFPTFFLADRITVQWNEYITGYPSYLRNRIVSLPNPVPSTTKLANATGSTGGIKRLLCVGRLSYQKNQSVLINAFAHLVSRYPHWQLTFVGTGEDEQLLKRLVVERGLTGRVEFTGALTDVECLYLASHLFCLPSRWEGFPNAMAEAMAHGLPVVGFRDCAGVAQLIEDRQTGYLAQGNGSVDSLASVLAALMGDDSARRQLGMAAAAAMADYAPNIVFTRWEAFLLEVASEK